MTSPLPQETITLNATELKQTIIKVLLSSIKHHYYLTVVQKKFTTFRKCDETELTIMYHNYMTSASKKQDYVSLSGCLLFSDKQKFQHFLKNFGTEFLINIYLDDELLDYKDKNPLDWLIQLNTTQNQITIQNISDNITYIISLLDQNATTMPSPEIAKETSQKMMLSQSLPKQITDWVCTAKTFFDVKLKNLMMTASKTFQMITIAPHQHHQINKPIFNP